MVVAEPRDFTDVPLEEVQRLIGTLDDKVLQQLGFEDALRWDGLEETASGSDDEFEVPDEREGAPVPPPSLDAGPELGGRLTAPRKRPPREQLWPGGAVDAALAVQVRHLLALTPEMEDDQGWPGRFAAVLPANGDQPGNHLLRLLEGDAGQQQQCNTKVPMNWASRHEKSLMNWASHPEKSLRSLCRQRASDDAGLHASVRADLLLSGTAPSSPSSVVVPKLHPGFAGSSQVQHSVYSRLQSQFREVADGSAVVREAELTAFVLSHLHSREPLQGEPLQGEPLQGEPAAASASASASASAARFEGLLRESVRRYCQTLALAEDGGIRVEDWIRFGLLAAAAPSEFAHHAVDQRMQQALKKRPMLAQELLDAFRAADVEGRGFLRMHDVRQAFLSGGSIAKEICVGKPGRVSYYDFEAFCLGCRRNPVYLNWYDVSKGLARWVPPAMLGGHKLEGIWHTGIVAFGREYWYGGRVLASKPGSAPFPPGPVRSTALGFTLRTRAELEDFLRLQLAPRYTLDGYCVLTRNCNHFTDEVASFLLQGEQIPEEARRQPEAIMSAPLLHVLRPHLNRWLGGFGAEGAAAGEVEDLAAEWCSRLCSGDIALLAPERTMRRERSRLVQVLSVDVGRSLCDVAYFQPGLAIAADIDGFWNWRLAERKGVPLLSLRPCTLGKRPGHRGSMWGSQWMYNDDIHRHLARKAVVYARCPRGHLMRPADGHLMIAPALTCAGSCGVCKCKLRADASRLECPCCAYYLCSLCDRQGLSEGYYGLGSVDPAEARQLLLRPAWARYKALRYLAAAGVGPGGVLGLDAWQQRVAARLYSDLGLDPPSRAELWELHSRFATGGSPQDGENAVLREEDFCLLVLELLTLLADEVSL